MHSFFRNKLLHFYRDTPQTGTILNHLRTVYPYVLPTIDHVAFRHVGPNPPINKMLLDFGFEDMGSIPLSAPSPGEIQRKARWFQKPHMPTIFSSYADLAPEDDAMSLRGTDHYVNWTLAHGGAINHVALDLSHYPDDLKQIMDLLADDLGIRMNDLGQVQISSDGLLLQGSCKAVVSDTGTSCLPPKGFVKFVQRKIDPETGEKRKGFDAFNATAIFDSTKK